MYTAEHAVCCHKVLLFHSNCENGCSSLWKCDVFTLIKQRWIKCAGRKKERKKESPLIRNWYSMNTAGSAWSPLALHRLSSWIFKSDSITRNCYITFGQIKDFSYNNCPEMCSAMAKHAGSAYTCARTYFFMSWSIIIVTLHIQYP